MLNNNKFCCRVTDAIGSCYAFEILELHSAFTSWDSYTLILRKLSRAFIPQRMHANHNPITVKWTK